MLEAWLRWRNETHDIKARLLGQLQLQPSHVRQSASLKIRHALCRPPMCVFVRSVCASVAEIDSGMLTLDIGESILAAVCTADPLSQCPSSRYPSIRLITVPQDPRSRSAATISVLHGTKQLTPNGVFRRALFDTPSLYPSKHLS